MSIDEITENFAFLDDWEDRYRYVIELGRELPSFPENARIDAYKVQGCVSQVWLVSEVGDCTPPTVSFIGDSDAHIVRGLIAILRRLYSGKTADEILAIDAREVFHGLGLDEHLSPQRSNGLFSMVERIRRDAQNALAAS